MDIKSKWLQWIVILIVVAFLLANPLTRGVILFLLPLGSGFDDLIEIVAIILLVGLLLALGWVQFDLGNFVRGLNAFARAKEVVLLAIFVGLIFLVPYTREMVLGLFLFGTPITDPTFFLTLAAEFVAVILGWALFSWRFK